MTVSDVLSQLDNMLADLAELKSHLEMRRVVLPEAVSEEAMRALDAVEFDVQLYRNQMAISRANGRLLDDDDASELKLPRHLDAEIAVANCRKLYDGAVQLMNAW